MRVRQENLTMASLFLQISVSLDGFIEDRDHDIEWLVSDASLDALSTATLKSIDGMILGRKAHELLAKFWPTVRLIVYPVLLGGGTRLFADDGRRRDFELMSTESFTSGATLQRCGRTVSDTMSAVTSASFRSSSPRFICRALGCVIVALSLAAPASARAWSDPSPHQVHLVEVEPGAKVELLDWGGSGEAVLLLAGHGDTAHVFDDFGPALAHGFRVLALTRRGFGASSQPEGGYDLSTLVRDIARVLDARGIDRVHLVGHSIAGDEMTRFARTHAGRLNTLTYLDAAYDRVKARQIEAGFPKLPPLPDTTLPERASVTQIRAFIARTVILMPEAEIRATRVFDTSGQFVRSVTPERILREVAMMVEPPMYEAIRARSLAIYAIPPSPGELIPRYKTRYAAGDAETRRVLEAIFKIWRPAAKAQRDQFRRQVRHGHVVELEGASHYVFISNRAAVIAAVRAFLRS
jgi:non-heme chloroperoxidase